MFCEQYLAVAYNPRAELGRALAPIMNGFPQRFWRSGSTAIVAIEHGSITGHDPGIVELGEEASVAS